MLKTFLYRSVQVSYTVTGKGKAVVLLHGFGEDRHVWDEQVNFLQEHCLVIVPDLPGSGESGMIPGADISMEDHADCLHALLQHEQISSCILMGHSMGGYITLAFAAKYPSALYSFGLIHSTAFADSEEKKKNREKAIAFMEEHGGYAFLKTSIPGLFGNRFKEEHPEKVAALVEASAHFRKEALQQYYRAMMKRPDAATVLKSNPLPVLFVMGTEDIAAPIQDVLQQAHLPNKSYIHVLTGVGHMGMWEEPGLLNGFLLDFINS